MYGCAPSQPVTNLVLFVQCALNKPLMGMDSVEQLPMAAEVAQHRVWVNAGAHN